MVRDARIPQEGCGQHRAGGVRGSVALAGRLIARLSLAAAVLTVVFSSPGYAQKTSSSFPKTPAIKFTSPTKLDRKQPLLLNGDELTYDTSGNRVIAKGNVELYYNNYSVTADEVTYDQAASTLTAAGNVTIRDPNGQITRADRIELTDDFKEGFVESLSVVGTDDTRIAARRAIRKDGNVTEFSDARYTPCKSNPGMPPMWCISAARIVHDQKAQSISFQDAQFEFLGVPIVPLPYFEAPDPTVKRRSGFLLPSVGSSTTLGVSVETPYYFALSPQYDFLFSPEYLSKQGILWKGDWRHRLANGEYEVKVAGIEQDYALLPSSIANRQVYDGWRGSLQTKGLFSLSSWWKFGWDVTVESDDTFRRFYKLDNILVTDRVNTVFLEGQSERNYFGMRFYQFGGLLLSDKATSESKVHPVIDYDYVFADPIMGGELAWKSNVLSLTRENALLGNKTESYNHAKTELAWRRRLTDGLGITYTPFGSVRGDAYYLDNAINPQSGNLITDDSVLRGVATGGVTVSYPWIAAGQGSSHTIEPIGQVLYSQAKVSQRALPNEDARSVVFDDTNLFEVQKFSGTDRVETGTRLNAGVQYTFQSHQGGYARFLAGQHYQLSGENAYSNPGQVTDLVGGVPTTRYLFSPSSGLQNDRSDYVLGAYFAPNSVFRFLSQTRLGEQDFGIRREDLFASVNYGPIMASAVYTYAAADPLLGIDKTQSDVTATVGLKLTDRWSVLGAVRFDIDAKSVLTDSIALKYADDCFVLTTTYQETFINNPALGLTNDRSVMVRFELKNLGGLNYKTSVLDHTFGDAQTPK
ncbi:MAG: LPS-assembly protein LptD [Hyphomicrobiaceae bacterium]